MLKDKMNNIFSRLNLLKILLAVLGLSLPFVFLSFLYEEPIYFIIVIVLGATGLLLTFVFVIVDVINTFKNLGKNLKKNKISYSNPFKAFEKYLDEEPILGLLIILISFFGLLYLAKGFGLSLLIGLFILTAAILFFKYALGDIAEFVSTRLMGTLIGIEGVLGIIIYLVLIIIGGWITLKILKFILVLILSI